MGNNCGPLVADLSLISYERDFRYCLFLTIVKVVRDPCQKITLLLLKSKSVRVIAPESCF